ncbi:MAG: class I SAM-dependent methyltransferase [Phycisphaerales bacterium]|nr:class I SAM-dependent methyltransferase [Phycisphaerales bacterium]
MSVRTRHLEDPMQNWMHDHSLRETDLQRALRREMESHPEGNMQTSAEQVQLMGLLVRAIGARRAVEVGVFTGYSALAIAAALPEDGRLVACDLSAEFMAIARGWWEKAGLSDRIEPRVGPAAESLKAMIEEGHAGTIDFMYIDADKTGYATYYELGLQLLRPGGLIALDNMFQGGRVADPANTEPDTVAIRQLALALQADDRIDYSLLPIGDGLGLAMKRPG